MTQYAVALIFPGELSGRMDALRHDYLNYVNYSIEPHITMVYPFTTDTEIALINEKLKQVAERKQAFTLVLDGIECFEGENSVAYVAIANKQPVIDLHYGLNEAIEGLITIEGQFRQFNLRSFIPHLTIGEIPDDVFLKAKESLWKIKIHYECQMNSFTLLSHGESGGWGREGVFSLSE